jgi:hypothetical protein
MWRAANQPIVRKCRALGWTRSGFYRERELGLLLIACGLIGDRRVAT